MEIRMDPDVMKLVAFGTLSINTQGYVRLSLNGKQTLLHQFVMGHHPGMHIDHINHDPLDNRRANLRVVTPSINALNRKKPGGVAFLKARATHKNPWVAYITVMYKRKHLGVFPTEEAARAARQQAELDLSEGQAGVYAAAGY